MRYAIAVVWFAGVACAPRPADSPAAETASSTQPPPAPPDTAAVLEAERAIWEAIKRHDVAAVDSALAGMTVRGADGWEDWKPGDAEQLKGITTGSYSWSNVRARVLTPDVVLLTYRATAEQTLGDQPLPSPRDFLSLWQRVEGKWRSIAHLELPTRTTP